MRLKQVILALFIVRFCVNISLSLLRFGIMVVREKNCYYAIALTDFFVFLSCAEMVNNILSIRQASLSVNMPLYKACLKLLPSCKVILC